MKVRQEKAESAEAQFLKIDKYCMQHLPKYNICWKWNGLFCAGLCVIVAKHTRTKSVWLELLYIGFTDYNINVWQATWQLHTNAMLRHETW